jgi:hypothetical protein
MKSAKRVPRKVWLLLALALVVGLSPAVGSWTGLFGAKSPRDAFLDAVAADWAKDPRLQVVRVDHETGQIIVRVKATGGALFFVVTKMEPQRWESEWKNESGEVIAFARGSGTQASAVHVDVPGLK